MALSLSFRLSLPHEELWAGEHEQFYRNFKSGPERNIRFAREYDLPGAGEHSLGTAASLLPAQGAQSYRNQSLEILIQGSPARIVELLRLLEVARSAQTKEEPTALNTETPPAIQSKFSLRGAIQRKFAAPPSLLASSTSSSPIKLPFSVPFLLSNDSDSPSE